MNAQETIEQYQTADEVKRIELYLQHPELREAFDAVDREAVCRAAAEEAREWWQWWHSWVGRFEAPPAVRADASFTEGLPVLARRVGGHDPQ